MSQFNTDDATGMQTSVSGGTAYIGREIHIYGAAHPPTSPSPPLPNISPYLAALCQYYQHWQTLYTLTDATGKQKLQAEFSRRSPQWESPFEFELMVQTPSRQEKSPEESEQQREKIERFSVLEGIRKYAQAHVLLVGRPGSGKSTALAKLVLEEATQGDRIPILVELRSWQGSIDALILNALHRQGLDLTNEQLPILWRDDRLLLLFDGLNELPSDEARSQLTTFRQNHRHIPMIFTTRDLSVGGDFGIEKRLEMQPLTEAQMQAFVRAYLPDQAEQMLRQLKDRLRELGQTPLLLWMLCGLFRQTGEIPENLGLVFRLFTQGYERNLKGEVAIDSDREWWKPVLQQLAWVMMQSLDRDKPVEFRVTIAKSEAVKAIAQYLAGKVPHAEDFARKCLRDLQKYHLIQAGAGYEELEFRHQLLQEYYAAEELLERLPEMSDRVLQQQYLNYLKWTEPVALMLALLDKPKEAERVVRSALEVDLFFGARLAGEVKVAFQEKTVNLITMIDIPPDLRVQCLGKTRSAAAIPELIKAVQDKVSYVRWETPKVDKNLEFRWRAVFALGELGSEVAIEELQKLQKDKSWDIHYRANEALEKIYGTSKRKDEDSEREDMTRALKTEVLELMSMLDDTNFSIRRNAIEELGGLGKEATIAIPKIIKMLDVYPDQPIAAIALGRLGCRSVIPKLLQMLRSTDRFAQMGAALALGDLGEEDTVPILLETLQDGDSKVRSYVTSALGMLGSEQALLGFLKALEDNYPEVRWQAARSLTQLENAFLPSLLPLLRHRCYHIGGDEVVEAIATIQSRCKYYNHDLYLAHQSARSIDLPQY